MRLTLAYIVTACMACFLAPASAKPMHGVSLHVMSHSVGNSMGYAQFSGVGAQMEVVVDVGQYKNLSGISYHPLWPWHPGADWSTIHYGFWGSSWGVPWYHQPGWGWRFIEPDEDTCDELERALPWFDENSFCEDF